MIRDRMGDQNRRWMLRTCEFWLCPAPESRASEVSGKPAGKFIMTDAIYDTNPWDGMSSIEDHRHFRYWENDSPWAREVADEHPDSAQNP